MVSPGFGASGFVMNRSYLRTRSAVVSCLTLLEAVETAPLAGRPPHAWNATGVPEVLNVTRDGPRATVTMARPDVRNAFNAALIGALRDAFGALGTDASVRYVVLA